MSILIKVVVGIFVVLMILGSVCVTIAAIFSHKKYKSDGKMPKSVVGDESIEDV